MCGCAIKALWLPLLCTTRMHTICQHACYAYASYTRSYLPTHLCAGPVEETATTAVLYCRHRGCNLNKFIVINQRCSTDSHSVLQLSCPKTCKAGCRSCISGIPILRNALAYHKSIHTRILLSMLRTHAVPLLTHLCAGPVEEAAEV